MTPAEQLAAAIQRVIDEAVDRIANGHAADASLTMTEAGKLLGFHPAHLSKLCVEGQLESTGTGRARRIPMSAITTYKLRHKNTRRKTMDFGESRAATATR